MKIKLNKDVLGKNLSSFLKNSLIEKYNKVKTDPNPTKIDIKFLAYHAIAYFQYLNVLNTNSAIRLYKKYILSDGRENKLKYNLFYFDSKEIKTKSQMIELPLYFDELLENVSKYLMNYKNIVDTITKDGYIKYFSKKYGINTSDITVYVIINILENITIYVLIALKRHWTIINKEIIPYFLEKTEVIKSKK